MSSHSIDAGADKVVIEVTTRQAEVISKALDVFSRIGIGQLEIISELVNESFIPMSTAEVERKVAPLATVEDIEELMLKAKALLGHPRGGNHGIGHRHNDQGACHAYEIHKVLAKVLLEHRAPSLRHFGTDSDGLIVRYTNSPAPRASIKSPTAKPEQPC